MFCGFQFQGRSSPIRLTAPLSVADRLLSGLSGMAQEHRSFSAIPTTRPARCATESTSSSIFGASERPSCRLGSCVRFFVPKILRLSLIANGWTADAATVPALRPAGSNRQQRCQYRRGEYVPINRWRYEYVPIDSTRRGVKRIILLSSMDLAAFLRHLGAFNRPCATGASIANSNRGF
jgi:hypothetical protein